MELIEYYGYKNEDLEQRLNLVRWQAAAERKKFSLLTIHSLLIDHNPKFIQLKQIIQEYNDQKDPYRVKYRQTYIERLFKMLSEMSRIPIAQNQLKYLDKVYEWAHATPNNDDDVYAKSRPNTASTRTRPNTAHTRPGTAKGYPITKKYQQPQVVIDRLIPKVDTTKLKQGDRQFYTGARSLHPQLEHPKKRLKDYQRKQYYEDHDDSQLQIIDLDTAQQPVKPLEQALPQVQVQQAEAEGAQGAQGAQGQLGEGEPAEGQPNIDDIPLEGQEAPAEEEPQEVIDKLKPRIKAYCYPDKVKINQRYFEEGQYEIREKHQEKQRKVIEDLEFANIGVQWAKSKARAQTALRKRAESASMASKRVGIPVIQKKSTNIPQNLINFENVTPVQVNSKGSRPLTAFNADNGKKRQQLIKKAFLTGRLQSHIAKQQQKKGLGSMTIVGQKPKKKTFEQILREAEERVEQQAIDEIEDVKQVLAKNKIVIGANKIAKSITYYQKQLIGDNFQGQITGVTLPKNPFMKVTKKKKKKKKK